MSGFDDEEVLDETHTGDGDPVRTLGFDGYAGATDPRDRHGGLLEDAGEEVYDEATYVEHAQMEAYRSGWVASGLTLDEDDRVLLVYHADHDHWMAPGGTLEPAETLHEGLCREIREEAALDVDPVRPLGVTEWIARNETAPATEWTGFRVAFYETTPDGADDRPQPATSDSDSTLGVDDEEITDAAWFSSLPENTFNRDLSARLLDRARSH